MSGHIERLGPSPTLSPPPGTSHDLEQRLFRHFSGWLWSERSRDRRSWAWQYGFDIQCESERRWVCRPCLEKRDSKPKSFSTGGLQNALDHLYLGHHIFAPEGKTKSDAERRDERRGKKKTYRSIANMLNLDLISRRSRFSPTT